MTFVNAVLVRVTDALLAPLAGLPPLAVVAGWALGSALAVLAWLKNPRHADSVERSIKYLAESCNAGRFGSPQSTVLALRAIVNSSRSSS